MGGTAAQFHIYKSSNFFYYMIYLLFIHNNFPPRAVGVCVGSCCLFLVFVLVVGFWCLFLLFVLVVCSWCLFLVFVLVASLVFFSSNQATLIYIARFSTYVFRAEVKARYKTW
jgi:hypothetical protein